MQRPARGSLARGAGALQRLGHATVGGPPLLPRANAAVSDLPPLPPELHERLSAWYWEKVHAHVPGGVLKASR